MINKMILNSGKTKSLALLSLILFLLSCNSDIENPPIDGLNVRFIDGLAFSDLMPVVPTDPINIRIELEMHNTNSAESFYDINVPTSSVFLDSSSEYLGDIEFSTDWDGHLRPGELDTITFRKNESGNASPFDPPCASLIFLDVNIHSGDDLKQITVDSLWYGCAF